MNQYPFLCALTATCGRHYHLEHLLKQFMDQDYPGDSLLLLYNNSEIAQQLAPLKMPANKRVFLINNSLDKQTLQPYTNLGAIYRDMLLYVPPLTDVVVHMDDDDAYLPSHFSEGVKGWQKAKALGKKAYKPQQSWYRHSGGTELAGNTLEPSIFMDKDHLLQHGYGLTTADQHLSWYWPLGEDLLVDPEGMPTFIYVWDGKDPVWKTSGDPSNPNNFHNYRSYSNDHGDRMVSPVSDKKIAPYYQLHAACSH